MPAFCTAASQVTLCLSKWIRAPMIGTPPLGKGPFSAFFRKPSPSAAPQRSKTRKPTKTPPNPTLMAHKALKAQLPHIRRIGRLRRTLPPKPNQATRHGVLDVVVERAFWRTGGLYGLKPVPTFPALRSESFRSLSTPWQSSTMVIAATSKQRFLQDTTKGY
jgi:hypothetical protein